MLRAPTPERRVMEIQLDLGSPDTPLHVVVSGRLDVGNASAFGQLMSHLQRAAGSGLTCDLSAVDVADAAGRGAVDAVRHQTEEFGGAIVVGRPVPVPRSSAPRDDG